MSIILREIYLDLDHQPGEINREAAHLLGLEPADISAVRLMRRALDARREPRIKFVYTAEVDLADASREAEAVEHAPGTTAKIAVPADDVPLEPGSRSLNGRVVVVGAGPAGLFAALRLAEAGYAPLVVERGRLVEERHEDVKAFGTDGRLSPESNVVFGEGGAGTYSDGKLTHRADSPEARLVVATLQSCGADDDILIDAKPHVGSDVLPKVIATIRERIRSLGGEIRFECRATAFAVEEGRVTRLRLTGATGDDDVSCGAVLVAPGSSARDTWRTLLDAGISLSQRPTLIGVRVEHPQEVVDHAQYGAIAGHPRLGAAEYYLANRRGPDRLPVHSFCMCPGGIVIPVASAPGMLSANGMSTHARDSGFANAALIAPVGPEDYADASPLAGVGFIERLERNTFELGGGFYSLPCQRLADFVDGKRSRTLPPAPDGTRRKLEKLSGHLPPAVENSIRVAAKAFVRKMRGFLSKDATVYGFELRTGSPVRIVRSDEGASPSAGNLFPAGEGAGYAGGIVSSAVDGLRQAANIIRIFARPST
jgi:uncharacterized FAD-dependent dehydrogenase